MRARWWLALGGVVVLGAAVCGCTVGGPSVVDVEACVLWEDDSDPQHAYEASDAVAVGTVLRADGTVSMYGLDAAVHEVAVTEVVKGAIDGDVIKVAATPVTCAGATYPDGDPLDVTGPVIVFLSAPNDDTPVWRLIAPSDAVLPLPADGTMPFDPQQTPVG